MVSDAVARLCGDYLHARAWRVGRSDLHDDRRFGLRLRTFLSPPAAFLTRSSLLLDKRNGRCRLALRNLQERSFNLLFGTPAPPRFAFASRCNLDLHIASGKFGGYLRPRLDLGLGENSLLARNGSG